MTVALLSPGPVQAGPALPQLVTSTGPWFNPPRFTATHMRQTIIQSWLCAQYPKAWQEPQRVNRHVQRLSVRGSKLYYLKYPVAAFRNGWILFNQNPKLRGPVRSILRNLRWISGLGEFSFVLVSNLAARPATHRQEFIDQIQTLGWKLVRRQRLVSKLPSRLGYDLGTQPESIEHFERWWKRVERFCEDFRLPPPQRDRTLDDRFIAFRIAQQLDPVEEEFIF